MKKIYLLSIAIVLSFVARATVHNISVSDNVFTPSDLTVMAGDSIVWTWTNGNHTTTSTNVPNGAGQWDAPINQNATYYIYVPTVSGSYDYKCTFHASMGMVAHFTVLEASGIAENVPGIVLNVYANPATRELQIDLNTEKSAQVNLSLNDITGRLVRSFASAQQTAGEHHMQYSLEGLTRGLYLLKLNLGENELVRKVIIQ